MIDALEFLARRAAANPHFLAHALAGWQWRERLSDDALAARLGLAATELNALRLCRACKDARDVRLVAEHFGCDASALAEAVGVEL